MFVARKSAGAIHPIFFRQLIFFDFKLNKCGNAKLKCTFGPDTSCPNGFQMGQSFNILKPPEGIYLVFQERRYI